MERRQFLQACLKAGIALPAARLLAGLDPPAAAAVARGRPLFPDPLRGWHGDSSLAAALRSGQVPPALPTPSRLPSEPPLALADRFHDLPRHFVFEYYPWYATSPVRHWDQFDRVPPLDLASNYVPRLGAYDSRAADVLEQHARSIADSGAGAVNLSWWGPGSFEDLGVPRIMDVMKDHALKVAFHIEPYAADHGRRYADDVLYLLEEYGAKRRWDALLLLQNEDGSQGPVFKSFRTILPEEVVDCHGRRRRALDFTADGVWRRQTDALRETLRHDFDHVTLLADSLAFDRTVAAGFDGIAIFDNFVEPPSYAGHAAGASQAGLLFSFNANPGYDQIEPRTVEPGACYAPLPFEPPAGEIDWTKAPERERAAGLSAQRVRQSLAATLAAQQDRGSTNAERGFLLVYLNSWNEWHEGHALEPMKDAAEIPPEQWAFGYHNPVDGGYRLAALRALLARVMEPRREPVLPSRV